MRVGLVGTKINIPLMNHIKVGKHLLVNQYIISQNKKYKGIMQDDGNFVIYKDKTPLWSTNTQGKYGKFVLHKDGNLILYIGNKKQWSSKKQMVN